jgi:hypothetical protein
MPQAALKQITTLVIPAAKRCRLIRMSSISCEPCQAPYLPELYLYCFTEIKKAAQINCATFFVRQFSFVCACWHDMNRTTALTNIAAT